ncbi:MAG: hypothetical protein H8E13_22060 [Actinobacteria bacterium]|nr:hypothetical protein [Actinomycetota bacterium]
MNLNLERLLDLKLKDLITDLEYREKKEKLVKEKENITISLLDKGVDEFGLEPVIKVLDFTTNLKNKFINADFSHKKLILQAFAKKMTLIDNKLIIEPNEWFEPLLENNVVNKISINDISMSDDVAPQSIGKVVAGCRVDYKTPVSTIGGQLSIIDFSRSLFDSYDASFVNIVVGDKTIVPETSISQTKVYEDDKVIIYFDSLSSEGVAFIVENLTDVNITIQAGVDNFMVMMILSIGAIAVGLKGPQILRQYLYKTGTSSVLVSSAGSAGRIGMIGMLVKR